MLERHKWNVFNVKHSLESVSEGWHAPLLRKLGHDFLPWPTISTSFFARVESDLLYKTSTIRRLPNCFTFSTVLFLTMFVKNKLDILNELCRFCHTWQTHSSRSLDFTVCFPDDAIFNSRIMMDLMYINEFPVLHIVDCGTNFPAACFISKVDIRTISEVFVLFRVNTCTGYPGRIHVDQIYAFNNIKNGLFSARKPLLSYLPVTQSHTIHFNKAKHIIQCSDKFTTKFAPHLHRFPAICVCLSLLK